MIFRSNMPAKVFLTFLLGLAVALCTGLSHAAAPSANATAEAPGLARIWTSRADDLVALLAEAQSLQANAEQMAKPLSGSLQQARAQFTRLTGLFQASRGHPTEQLTLVQQMHSLLDDLHANIAPLEQIAATINQRREEVAALQKDIDAFANDGGGAVPGLEMEDQALKNYTQTLKTAGRTLASASSRLDGFLAPAKAIRDRMTRGIAETEGSLVGIWENYYLTPSGTNLDALASTPALLADWVTSLASRMAFAYPQSLDEWLDAAKGFFFTALIMITLGALALRGAAGLPERWSRACESVIKMAWLFIGLGLAVLAASANKNGGIYFAFVLLGALFIIRGIASMSWRLRVAVVPELETKPSPLFRLYVPAAIGVLMLFSDLPTRILGIMWGLVMVVFLAFIFSFNRKRGPESLPLLEHISYSSAFWFALGSLIVTVAGYARMAILLFMLLFALINTITLGNALMNLLALLVDRVFSKSTQPVRNALAQAVSVPVAWLLSLMCALPWIWAVPGARYLVMNALAANYTVGEASFDFSKIFFIVLLFFVFRSFITLGRTSLTLLPERMPNIEKGVIPPLGTMMTYGLWALFGIIALGMLGVNFTSLAVVAGGLSVGIGFGMQNIFNNLISGIMLIFGRTLLVGDYVEVAGAAGTVRAISIRSTTIETVERALVYVPNSAIMAGQFTNWTRNSRLVRRSIIIGVAYGSDTELVSKIMLEAAKKQEHVLVLPAPAVFFTNFGDNALEFTLNVFIDDLDNAVSALSALRYELERQFVANNIDIPYPQLTLHMPLNGEQAPEAPAKGGPPEQGKPKAPEQP